MIAGALLAVVLFQAAISALPTQNSTEPTFDIEAPRFGIEAPRRGGDGGTELNFICPFNGAITAINYRIGLMVDQLSFVCSSWAGKTTFGPYGGGGGSSGTIQCPPRYYISSIYGRSNYRLDRLGIRCRHDTDMTSHGIDSGEFGGMGGTAFDDVAFSRGSRPIGISVRSGDLLDAIQITYGNNHLDELCTVCHHYREEWAAKHGGGGGRMYAFSCPDEGVITGISYRAGDSLDFIQFTCMSYLGQTTMEPYGGTGGGTQLRDLCDSGYYISSIHGRSSNVVNRFGIRCVRPGSTGTSPPRHGHGGDGGDPFDDEYYSLQGHRPVQIRVWAGHQIDAIQMQYANMPVYFPPWYGRNTTSDLIENSLQIDFVNKIAVIP